ncbi:MAG: hypothetical protein K9N35_04385 [Candidatus Marinimicrobia bacterium]|nr:hypothetical protein [Candidatus Neomarinimicrobiota bacterium]
MKLLLYTMSKIDLSTIIPRWEWRSFRDTFGSAEMIIQQHESTRTIESEELYILSRLHDVNIKIRDRKVEIKKLLEINDDGLEKWTPVLKAAFPLSCDVVTDILKAVDLVMDNQTGVTIELDAFLGTYVKTNPSLQIVEVTKSRSGYEIDGVRIELADLKIAGQGIRTMAVEDEDPRLVIALVKKLDLIKFANINYIRAMQRMLGFEDERWPKR